MPHKKVIQKQKDLKQESNETIPLKEVEKLLLEQEKHLKQTLQIQMTQIRSAPTPSPDELKQLKQIDKSFPDRLIAMAENEQKFRHRSTYFGQSGLIIIVLGGYALAGVAGIYSPFVGSAIAVGVSYIAYVFKNSNPKPPKKLDT